MSAAPLLHHVEHVQARDRPDPKFHLPRLHSTEQIRGSLQPLRPQLRALLFTQRN